jgi:hypothetical protein
MHLAMTLGLLALAGCGARSDGFERFPVEGVVTLDTQPLKAGTIIFNAQNLGASSSGPVVDGKFRFAAKDGLSPGPYRVEIYGIEPTGRKIPSADDPNQLVDETVNLIPKQYNLQSTLTVELPPGGPQEALSFALTRATKKPVRR